MIDEFEVERSLCEWTVEYLRFSIDRRCLNGNVEVTRNEEWMPAKDFIGRAPGGVTIHTLEYCVEWYRNWYDGGRIFRMMNRQPPPYRIRNVHTGETILCDVL